MPGVVYSRDEAPLLCYTRLLLAQLHSRSALQRSAAAAVTRQWAAQYTAQPTSGNGVAASNGDEPCKQGAAKAYLTNESSTAMEELYTALINCLTQPVYYDEIAISFSRYLYTRLELSVLLCEQY